VSAEESRDLVSGAETTFESAQSVQALMLELFNLIYRSAESSSQLENSNIIYDTKLWDGDHHVLSLSGYSRYLETNAKVLSLFLEHFTYFMK